MNATTTFEGSTSRPSRSVVCFLFAIVLGQVISYLPALSSEFRFNNWTGRDDIEMYIALGHSLAHGRGYTRSFDPEHYIAHVHWPPGFPLLIAGTFLLTDTLWAAQALVMFFAVANALLLWAIARRYLGELVALLATLMLVCTPIYDQMATFVIAEQPTTFFLLLSLWSLGHWVRGGYRLDCWAVLAVLAIGYGVLVKGLVLPVVAGFGLYALFCPRNYPPGRFVRLSRTCFLFGIALLPWMLWTVRGMIVKAPGYDGYTEIRCYLTGENVNNPILLPTAFLGFTWTNLKWYVADRVLDAFGGTAWNLKEILGIQLPVWARMATLGFLGLSFLIALRSFRRDGFITAALAMALLMLATRPCGGYPRYWLNVQPLFLLVLLGAFQKVWQGLDNRYGLQRWNWLPHAGGIALVSLALAALIADHLRREPQGSKVWDNYVTMCQQVRELTPPEAVVISHNENATRWITHRFSIPTESDLDGRSGHPLYVIYPLPEAVAKHNLKVPVDRFEGRLVEVAHNDYYALYCVRAELR